MSHIYSPLLPLSFPRPLPHNASLQILCPLRRRPVPKVPHPTAQAPETPQGRLQRGLARGHRAHIRARPVVPRCPPRVLTLVLQASASTGNPPGRPTPAAAAAGETSSSSIISTRAASIVQRNRSRATSRSCATCGRANQVARLVPLPPPLSPLLSRIPSRRRGRGAFPRNHPPPLRKGRGLP